MIHSSVVDIWRVITVPVVYLSVVYLSVSIPMYHRLCT